jgi:hypothetical protein
MAHRVKRHLLYAGKQFRRYFLQAQHIKIQMLDEIAHLFEFLVVAEDVPGIYLHSI